MNLTDATEAGARNALFWRAGWAVAVLAALALTAANLLLGDLNQDEGWYLYAARMVAEGRLPYRDFAFTQGPVMPLVYAPFHPLTARWGLAAGRALTAALALIGAALAARLAYGMVGRNQRAAALLAFALAAVNVYQSYHTTVVKTYALAALLMTAGFLALAAAIRRRQPWPAWVAGALLALAAGTRSSAAVALPVSLAVLWTARRDLPRLWLHFALAGMFAGGLVLIPWLITAPANFWFFAVRYHTLRETGGSLPALVYRIGFISRMLQGYFAAAALAIFCLARIGAAGTAPPAASGAGRPLARAIWLTLAGVTLVHLAAPFPYDDYQVFVYPLFAAALAALAVNRLAAGPVAAGRLAVAGLLLCILAAGSSPLNQEWVISGRDRIWWQIRATPPLFKLRAVAGTIRELSAPDDLLLTQDPYLAVESNRRLPRGLEMGQFSYFPELTREQAEKRNVLNRELLSELLQASAAPVAALSGYAFAIESPAIRPLPAADREYFMEIIGQRYRPLMEVAGFGQAATTLRIMSRDKE